ncbi:glycosyltransferase [Paenibacillus tarimensis]|uniref:glycosyltransferase n=1 Tax=Paenibacillus tarimensis TaxID=416012 RepID=UPI001F1F7951|nr:glycosyltransferase [Paenibacillus tarimensis]MCF2945622.1 hypothetical protein [Paenibacillus tarimensis]
MRRIFFGLSGGLGPVLRTLPIAEQHRQAGDTVSFSIYDQQAARYLENNGYRHVADQDPTVPNPGLLVSRGSTFYHLDHYYAGLGLADYTFVRSWILSRIAMLKSIAPHLVYADLSPHTIIAARYLGIPVVSLTQACFHPAGLPLHYWSRPPRNVSRVTPVVNRVLQELGLSPVSRMEELTTGDITVVPSIPELDPIRGEAVHYVGPIGEEQKVNPATREFADLSPDVLVYAGRVSDTAGDSGLRLVRIVQEAFRGKPERVAIVYSGKLPVQEARTMPSSIVRVERFHPGWLSKAKLYIHHGGHGSCLSSMLHAVPSLIVPTHSEREYNARNLWKQGGCEYVLPDTCTSGHFYELARYVMEDEYRRNLEMLRESIRGRAYGGAKHAYRLGRSLIRLEAGGMR